MTQILESTKGWQKLDKCPLCESSNYGILYPEIIDRHYGISGEFIIAKCNNCSLVFLNPLPDDSILVNLYPEDFYAYQDLMPKKSLLKKVLRNVLLVGMDTKDPKFDNPGKILDIGCGSGQFLSKMKDKGWDCYGVEVSSDASEIGNKSADLNIFTGSLVDASFPSNHFEYIRSNHSFEHVYNPNETMSEIYRILKPGGKLFIGVPNIESLNAQIFGEYWWYLGAPVHTFNYSARTLTKMIEKHGLTVENVRCNSNYSGLLGSLQIYLNRTSHKLSTDGFMITNPVLIVVSHYLSKVIDLFRSGDAIEIISSK